MHSDDRSELAGQLFAFLTAMLDDAAALALEGQDASMSADDWIDLAARLQAAGNGAITLANAVVVILKR